MNENVKFTTVLLLIAIILSCSLGRWDLRGHDEPRYAQVAREMLKSGSYFVPHLNGAVYSEKPPLFFWLVAASSRIVDRGTEGPSSYAARLPSAVAGIGTLIVLYFLCRNLYGSTVALWSVLILFTTPQFVSMCLDAHLDSTLTFWVILAIFLFHRGLDQGRDPKRKNLFFLSAYGAMGLGVLTKGPVGFLIPMITIVLYLLIKKDLAVLRGIRPFSGFIIVIAIVALWLLPAYLFAGPEYLKIMLFKQNVGRAISSFSHQQPFYYYLESFPEDFVPWTFFIPGACIHFWRRRRDVSAILLPLVWFVATFIFFSLMSGKRSLYLLPIFPAAAILIAKFWSDAISAVQQGHGDEQPLSIRLPCYLLFGGTFLLACVTMLFPGLVAGASDLPPRMLLAQLYPLGVVSAVAGALGIFLLVKRFHLKTMLYLIVVSVASVVLVLVVRINPALDTINSLRPFSERVKIAAPSTTPLAATFNPEHFNYFLHRYPIKTVDFANVKKEMYSTPGLLVLHKIRAKNAPESLQIPGVEVIDTATVDSATYYLLSKER